MRTFLKLTFASLLQALAFVACVRAEEAIPPEADWPGPLVEVTLQEPAGQKRTGFMLSYQEGRMQFRPLDGQPDQEWNAPKIEALRFLPPPPPPKLPPPPVETKSASASNSDSKTEPPGPDTRPFLGPRGRDRIEKFRELAEPSGMDKLTPAERERYRELTVRHLAKHTQEEMRELNALREKLDLPSFEVYHRARNEVSYAKEGGKLDFFVEKLRKDLKASKDFEEARRCIITILLSLREKNPNPGDFLLGLRSNVDDEIDRIADPVLRDKVRSAKSDIVLDFAGPNMRMEKQDRDKPDRDGPPKGMMRKTE